MDAYDLIVIGGGAAGSTVASEANQRGARVAQIERWKVGGTCLNTGCDPTKTLVRAAQVLHDARTADRHGIRVSDAVVDWPAVRARVHQVIETIRGGDGDANVRASDIDLYKGHARFTDPHTITIDGPDATTIHADKVVIATGAAEIHPDISGLAEIGYWTNNELVDLKALPLSLAIIGGGVVAVEFAQIFARFGVDVTLLGSAPQLLPKEDSDLAAELASILHHERVDVQTGVKITEVRSSGTHHCVIGERQDNGETTELCAVNAILVAVGRKPALEDMGLNAAGVEYDPDDGITVDDELRTTAEHIWAAGDCTGGFPFTHYANYQARIAEHNAMSGPPARKATDKAVPWTTFTDPELARVGLTEREAIEAGHDVQTATVHLKDITRATTSDQRQGLVKLVTDRVTGHILGGHILAPHGGDLLAEVVLAMRHRLPVTAIADSIHSYPTFGESVFWTAFQLAKPEAAAMAAVRGIGACHESL